MPLTPVQLRPGIDTEQTPLLNAAGYSQSQLIRWREGLLEKLGGWAHLNYQFITGTGRGSHGWADLANNPYFAVGTEQRLQIFAFGTLFDVTPVQKTDNITPAFTTVANSKTVKVTDTAHGATAGDWVLIPVPVSIGGTIIQGFYQVQAVIDANNYTITVFQSAMVNAGPNGIVPSFTTTITSGIVTVTLNNHNLVAGSLFGVQVATTVGGITIPVASYPIASPTNNTFTITPGTVATGNATVAENNGNARIEYLIPTGVVTATLLSGYGAGAYGAGPYGGSQTSGIISTIRQWFLDHWGQDLIGNYTGGPMLVWTPPLAVVPGVPWPTTYGSAGPMSAIPANPAVIINTTNFPGATSPPATVNTSFVSMPQQIAVAVGCDPVGGGTQDANLIRWSDVDDFTDWVATATNQAGSFRLPNGSKIVSALQGPLYGYFWTDVDFWTMQYIGFPLVFGFTKAASGCELLAPHAAGVYNSTAYWPSSEQFFAYDGNSVQVLECTVADKFFKNLNVSQSAKVWCWVNSAFNELWWFYPSLNSTECDSYIKYNTLYRCWDYGLLPRTTGIDTNPYGPPIACDTSGYIQQHEVGYDADGQAMMPSAQTGQFAIAEGEFLTFIERVVADFTVIGGTAPNNRVFLAFYVQDFPTDTIYQYGPFAWTPSGPPYNIVRARGRVVAMKISSTDLGVFWRFGKPRLNQMPAGKR